jgi:hypothetical protein
VRLFLGDRETGREWHDEWHVAGTIGRSMGPLKVPLLIANKRSSGGGAILCDCIVRLLVNGREVYRHPKWKASEFAVAEIDDKETAGKVNLRADGYTHCATINGERVANFKSRQAADRWCAFMKGERASK